jgi:hypothetical protein
LELIEDNYAADAMELKSEKNKAEQQIEQCQHLKLDR